MSRRAIDAAIWEQVTAERDRLRAFVAELMREGPWQGGDWDGGALQDLAEKHGVIKRVAYDPKRHGLAGMLDVEPGDDWYVLAWSEAGSGPEQGSCDNRVKFNEAAGYSALD